MWSFRGILEITNPVAPCGLITLTCVRFPPVDMVPYPTMPYFDISEMSRIL